MGGHPDDHLGGGPEAQLDGRPQAAKRRLRGEMRAMRRELPDRERRSERLWGFVRARDEYAAATTVMVFDSIPGEPITAAFIEACRGDGKLVVVPEEDPEPCAIDLVIVPGTAFTPDGRRLGQGGGWYDRFLPRLRPGCPTIGVGFEPQVVSDLPTEAHDVVLDVVITDAGVAATP